MTRSDTFSDMESALLIEEVADVVSKGVEQNMSGHFDSPPLPISEGVGCINMIPLPGFEHDG